FESKPTSAASHYKRINMKTLPLCICSVVLAVTAMAQPAPPPPPPPSPAASMTASASPAQDLADRIHQRIEKKLKGRHGIAIDGRKGPTDSAGLARSAYTRRPATLRHAPRCCALHGWLGPHAFFRRSERVGGWLVGHRRDSLCDWPRLPTRVEVGGKEGHFVA